MTYFNETQNSLRLALYQPEIPQNTGTLMRFCACVGIALDIIEPCGFVWDDRKLQRAGMDYRDLATVQRHPSWTSFLNAHKTRRIILLDTRASLSYDDMIFKESDILLVGRESDGVPEEVASTLPHKVRIPMLEGRRSLNMAIAGSIVMSEALRQLRKKKE